MSLEEWRSLLEFGDRRGDEEEEEEEDERRRKIGTSRMEREPAWQKPMYFSFSHVSIALFIGEG